MIYLLAHLQEWSWVEEGWIVDTQGIADDAVDIEGWSYARDFSGLRMPPAPGAGKFRKVKHLSHSHGLSASQD